MSENDDRDVDIELFLEVVKNRQKFPRSCVIAYERLHEAGDTTSERIFFDHGGTSAWAAYVLTRMIAEGTGHASGKTKRQRLLRRVDAMPSDDRRQLARRLGAAIGPDRERIEQVVKNARQQPDRARGQRSTTTQQNSDDDSDADRDNEASARNSQPAAAGSAEGAPSSSEQVFRMASIAACTAIFPPYIAAAIKRKTNQGSPQPFASVTMSMRAGSSECELRLEITANKVEYLARELFGAHLETETESRHVYLMGPTSPRAVPYPSLMLTGCRPAAVQEIFGTEIANAIFATVIHQQEAKEVRACTQCITMVISQASSSNADICLLLPVAQGAALRDQLYPDAGQALRDT